MPQGNRETNGGLTPHNGHCLLGAATIRDMKNSRKSGTKTEGLLTTAILLGHTYKLIEQQLPIA
jgi:hypothetical protein